MMAMRTRKREVSFFDVRIKLLNKSTFDVRIKLLNKSTIEVPAIEVFTTVGDILALVRVSSRVLHLSVSTQRWPNQDKMINNKDSVELSGYCFNVCEVLKTVIHGQNADDLSELVRMALEDLGRCVDLALALSVSLQVTPGLCGKSSGLSGGGLPCQSLNITKARSRGTSWRSRRFSMLSTHHAHSSMETSPWMNVRSS